MIQLLKQCIHGAMMLNPFYHAQQRKIKHLTLQIEQIKEQLGRPLGEAGVARNRVVIESLLEALGADESVETINGQQIAMAIKRHVMKYTDHSGGGSTSVKPNTEPRVLFFHMPKAGGSSIHHEFLEYYHPLSVYTARHILDFDYRNSISELALHYDLPEQCFSNEQYIEHFPLYLSRYVSGHFSFHLIKQYVKVFDFVTVLRRPAERLYSAFNYIKLDYARRNLEGSRDAEVLKARYGKPYFEDLTIRDFVEGNPMTSQGYQDNLLARLLVDGLGSESRSLLATGVDVEQCVEQAMQSLEQFKHVGFLEDLSAFDRFMQQNYGFAEFDSTNRKINVTADIVVENQPKNQTEHAWREAGFVSKAECIDYLERSDACAIDNEIYARAVKRFSENAALWESVQDLALAEPCTV